MRVWAYVLGGTALLAGVAMALTATGRHVEAEAIAQPAASPAQAPRSAFDFTMTRIDGKPLPFSQFRGQVLLVVNTASMCGFTPQYDGLQKLHERYKTRGFTVIGVPSGDFMGQEYDDNRKIAEFCETRFGITFPMTEKARVKGRDAAPFYQWARASLAANNEPQWNFHKFLVGRDGRLIAGFGSRVEPGSPELVAAIEKALGA
ncbi:glutathione peroxidase [Thermaurantiacus tibetensis]|nr:glutathione peroxidase [Thermaurantiacus tibetensis]